VPASGPLGSGQVSVWAEWLGTTASDTLPLLQYGNSNGWLDGQDAVVSRAYGRGRITYIGTVLDEKLMQSAAEWMAKTTNITPAFGPVPEGIEASRRVGPNFTVYVLINWRTEPQTIALPHAMQSLLNEKEVTQIQLPQYGVALLSDSLKR